MATICSNRRIAIANDTHTQSPLQHIWIVISCHMANADNYVNGKQLTSIIVWLHSITYLIEFVRLVILVSIALIPQRSYICNWTNFFVAIRNSWHKHNDALTCEAYEAGRWSVQDVGRIIINFYSSTNLLAAEQGLTETGQIFADAYNTTCVCAHLYTVDCDCWIAPCRHVYSTIDPWNVVWFFDFSIFSF